MSVVDDEPGAPAVRCIGFAEFAHDLEPGIEAKAVAADTFRQQYPGKARIEHFLDRLARYLPGLFRLSRARGKFRRERSRELYDPFLGYNRRIQHSPIITDMDGRR